MTAEDDGEAAGETPDPDVSLSRWFDRVESEGEMMGNVANDLNAENLEDARFTGKIDPVGQLRRIGIAWHAIGRTCACTQSGSACDVCEIYYLLEEAFELDTDDGE